MRTLKAVICVLTCIEDYSDFFFLKKAVMIYVKVIMSLKKIFNHTNRSGSDFIEKM